MKQVTVGIFGDSFADENVFKDKPGLSWVEYLRNYYARDVKSYGKAGTSLYYSYELFLDNYKYYDKVIFVCTDLGRVTLPHYITFKSTKYEWLRHIPNHDTAQNHLRPDALELHTPDSINATKAAMEYFKYLYDFKKEERIQNLILGDILAKRPDALILYLHKNQSPYQPIDMVGLIDISVKEVVPYGYEHTPIVMDTRKCHMSEVNNKNLAGLLNNWIGGQEISLALNEFEVPPREEIDAKVEFKK